ncbi:MAG: tetratricopeptide repeat protein [Desulfobacteraceae bacterium]|nr:tetratricopeptide repeat protein [Desulfobacteraceae bacterium]MBC2753531.1 tetratricopeptide repeat protein [Desulfobacteraceae bacterium]
MSLLNDALRKRDREQRSPGKIAGDFSQGAAPRNKRHRRYGMVAILTALLLVIGVGVGLIVYSFEATSVLALEPPPSIRAEDVVGADAAPLPNPEVRASFEESTVPSPETRESMTTTASVPGQPIAVDSIDRRPEDESASTPSDRVPVPKRLDNAHEVSERLHATISDQTAVRPAVIAPIATGRETSPPAGPGPQAERYYRKALSYHRQGRMDRAIALYREVVQLQPKHFDARFNLVSAYIDTREFTKAHRIASELYRQDSTNQQVLANLAIAKIGLGQSREALQLLDQVEELPHAAMFAVYLHKGLAYRNLDQLETAIGWYQSAEKLKPDNPQLLFNLALAHDRQQHYREAVHYYQAYMQQVQDDEQGRAVKDIRQRIHTLRSYVAEMTAQEQRGQ